MNPNGLCMFEDIVRRPTDGLHQLLNWVYPAHCYHCQRPLNPAGNPLLCGDCRRWLDRQRITPPLCGTCGLPLSGRDGMTECVNCRMLRPRYRLARSIFTYSGPAESIVHSFKYEGNYFLGPRLLKRAINRDWFPADLGGYDSVVPVPLHSRRRRDRGFNQAAMLGRVISRDRQLILLRDALRRERNTPKQASLSRSKRRENVKRAFIQGRQEVKGQKVLLVDDVMTTGATAGECARTLSRGGAEVVDVFTLIRAAQ